MSRRRTLNAAQRAVLIRAIGHELEWSSIVDTLIKRGLMSYADIRIGPHHACKLYALTARGRSVVLQLVRAGAHA